MVRLKYLDPADQQYKLLPVGGGSGGGPDEVTIDPNPPGSPYTDLWVDTDAPAPITDWSVADNRYLTSGFRNVIRNGDMSITQRGLGPWSSGYTYTVDGWLKSSSGGASTFQRISQPVGSGSPAMMSVTSGQSGAGDYVVMQSRGEDVATLSGRQVVLSFDAWASTGTPKIGLSFGQEFGASGSANVSLPIGAVTLSSTKQRFTVSFTVPSIAGKTMGTTASAFITSFWLSAGSSNATESSGIGIQNATIYITDVQLEAGNTASPFERLPVQQQLAWCQRYFWRHGSDNPHVNAANDYVFGYGYGLSTTRCDFFVDYPVHMRANPTINFSSQTSGFCVAKGTAVYQPITAANTARVSANRAELYLFVASGLTADVVYTGARFSSATAYIDFSAEL